MRAPQQLQHWVETVLETNIVKLEALAGDASLRRYYRASLPDQTYIVMDASAANDETEAFVALARSFKSASLGVPTVHYADVAQGHVLLSDLGDTLYSQVLNDKTADQLYQSALSELLKLQACQHIKGYQLPPYDRQRLIAEMSLFDEWFWRQHLARDLSAGDQELLDENYELLAKEALAQPRVCVHRDYHSRNLMLLPNKTVGILDFQDAVLGPITYDLVSLLRDCYIDWPVNKVQEWLKYFYQQLKQTTHLENVDYAQFERWFDWMGLQRHLKCLGIFCRLNRRDQKPGYLQYLPRVLNYARQVTQRYDELKSLNQFLSQIEI
ncbi:MAG TPA: phosphotransferase [Coxiellaceae bacterium]|nr:phosphotransferase [Coxiellaceae bacterium]